jgi:cytochrome c peroxidase
MQRLSPQIFFTGALLLLAHCAQSNTPLIDEAKAELGRQIFFDTSLSEPVGQSCGSCHAPSAGFAAPAGIMTAGIAHGADATKFAKRNPPTIAYAQFSPTPYFSSDSNTRVGGQFLDQRTGTLAAQALEPFLGAVEMANTSRAQVVTKLQARPYASEFKSVFGDGIFSDTETAFKMIGEAIAEFERQPAVSPFTSKFDYYRAGKLSLTSAELRGLDLFNGKGGCAACHPSAGSSPLFTDFTNDNIGVPKNTSNPFYTQSATINPDGANFIDKGLGVTLGDSSFDGRFKVPTLRNIAVTAPYMHNGVFTSLTQVVNFYNTACAAGNPDGWAAPEVSGTRNCKELGDLGLTVDETEAIVAFLETLTDGFPR